MTARRDDLGTATGPASPVRRLTLSQARRMALGAQGFTRPRPEVVTARDLVRVLSTVQVVQIDSGFLSVHDDKVTLVAEHVDTDAAPRAERH